MTLEQLQSVCFERPAFASPPSPLRKPAPRLELLILIVAGVLLLGRAWLHRPNGLIYPLQGRIITSDFGYRKHPLSKVSKFHAGVDLRGAEGEVVRAVSDGRVVFSAKSPGYGNLVAVWHGKGFSTHYAHLRERFVRFGEIVHAGAALGTVGRTGSVTGPHLHLEFRILGKPTDPKGLLPDLENL